MKNKTKHINYRSWQAMKSRCYNKNNEKYKNYGARGITVCDRWIDSFENFVEDMGEKPSKNHTLDRKEIDGDYTPENCRWLTHGLQAINKTNNSQTIGVRKNHADYQAYITVNGIHISKSFKDLQKAIDYRKELELKYLTINN